MYKQKDIVDISDQLVRRAGILAQDHSLRGYDAVHLAAAETLSSQEIVFVSGDGPLCTAANNIGLAVART